ncbi:nuclear receptor subfamily 0 group B member 2 [Solea senegalensis]|uniref:Nuclear receptor subfamily 0 group B member 2 n=1 Tax=Solea senegalensis TaxID=28829 RepID=A0AAV6PST5_SOLSE|nr:nuclear receptor subfamily 0 group B member 2a [Solea senegalensis]XP_058504615.1 nuclear receptor subfamily 0 group B member 2a [Solea solea]KAG7474387.1 nuclear receptor subfamily 0 group B member 2 [Solea senegalensis]
MDTGCHCSTNGDRLSNPILYNILSQMDNSQFNQTSFNYTSVPHRCNCELRRTVCLKRPVEICKEASAVLVKTIHFMKNLPAFNQLPPDDQFSLLKSCWAPLFILGLAQEHVDFEVTDTAADSMLKKILLNRQESPETEREQPTIGGVSKLKSCLKKFWSLDLSPKEYAYLKGTTIFNPDVPDMKAARFVEGLQQEAQHALSEVVQLTHPGDQERFARILLTASTLQSITPSLITELFFRPVIGQADLLELLVDMLFCR